MEKQTSFNKQDKKALVIIFVIALFIRLFLSFYFLNPRFEINNDIKRYAEWGIIGRTYGIGQTYAPYNQKHGSSVNNQPFGTVYIYSGAFLLYQETMKFAGSTFGIKYSLKEFNDNFLYVVKMIPILFDLSLGLLIYLIVKKFGKTRHAYLSLCLYLFNPVVLYNSPVWGQTDVVNNFFLVLSLYLLYEQHPVLSIVSFISSLLIKLSLLPLIPLYLILFYFINRNKIKTLLISLFGGLAYLLVLTYTVSTNPFVWIINFIKNNASGELIFISNYSLNFWWMIFRPKLMTGIPTSTERWSGITLDLWANGIFIVLYLLLIVSFHKKGKKFKIDTVLIYFIVAEFIMFLFLPRMHERYLFPIFPLFAIYIGLTGRYLILFLISVIINFVNVYLVWHPLYFLPILLEGLIAHWKVRLLMSMTLVLIGIYLYLRLFFGDSIDRLFNKKEMKFLSLFL